MQLQVSIKYPFRYYMLQWHDDAIVCVCEWMKQKHSRQCCLEACLWMRQLLIRRAAALCRYTEFFMMAGSLASISAVQIHSSKNSERKRESVCVLGGHDLDCKCIQQQRKGQIFRNSLMGWNFNLHLSSVTYFFLRLNASSPATEQNGIQVLKFLCGL